MVIDKPYLSQVRQYLTCSAVSRRRLLAQAGQMVENFCQENPGADEAALAAAFGGPREFAAQMLATLEPAEVAAAERRGKLAKTGAILLVILTLTLTSVVCFLKWQKAQEVVNGNFYVVIEPARTYTDEEAERLRNDPNISWEGD